MKSIYQYLYESINTSSHKHYTKFPKSKEELKQMIEAEISKNGYQCSLNHIDVSRITDMSRLFYNSNFNGDISGWDVSSVEDMYCMFAQSEFNGDISSWDVSNVTDMSYMFAQSEFNGDISSWDVSNVKNMRYMFKDSVLEKNPPKWYH